MKNKCYSSTTIFLIIKVEFIAKTGKIVTIIIDFYVEIHMFL